MIELNNKEQLIYYMVANLRLSRYDIRFLQNLEKISLVKKRITSNQVELVDKLIELNHSIIVLDNLISGFEKNINTKATFSNSDISILENIEKYFIDIDGIFHLAAIARTPWCIDNPILAYQTNVIGTLNILEIARKKGIKRVVMTSSNVIYAYWTPYRSSKEALESLGRVYTDDGYSNLIDSASNIKGNIFYDRGLVVVTKDVVSGSVLHDFTLNYRSTKTIYENEIFLSVLENEFNVSQNPSAVDFNGTDFGKIKLHNIKSSIVNNKFGGFGDYEFSSSVDPTGSYLAPYITTIGLYDNELNMVAIAKLPQPIKSLPDYPVNFIIRFDT